MGNFREGFILVLFLQFIIPSQAQDPYTGEGYADMYRLHLNKMLSLLDDEVLPCDDFFQHACGKNNNKKVTSHLDDLPLFLYNYQDRYLFFDETRHRFRTKPGRILNDLYRKCKKTNNRSALSPKRHWQRLLQEVPFLTKNIKLYSHGPFMDFQWKYLRQGMNINWVTIAAHFAAHGLQIFFKVFFAQQAIFVAPFDEEIDCGIARFTGSNLLHLLRQNNRKYVNTIAHELRTFCYKLLATYQTETGIGSNNGQFLLDENIVHYLDIYFSILGLTEQEVQAAEKIPIDIDGLRRVLYLLNTTDPRIIYNFVLVHAQEKLRIRDCYLLVEEFEQLIQFEYWNWYVFDPHFSREVAMAMYLLHTFRFQKTRKKLLNSGDWNSKFFPKLERKDFNIERLIGNFVRTNNISQLYNMEKFEYGTFYQNLMQLRKEKLRASFYLPHADNEDINHGAYYLEKFLHFSILLLKRPLFHYYVTEAYDMWDKSGILYSSDEYYTAYDCLDKQFKIHGDAQESHIFSALSTDEVKELLHFYRPFSEVLQDYYFWLESESFAFAEDFVLEYFNFSSRNIMFYAMAQLHCDRNDPVKRRLINRSFMNTIAFQESFNCSADAIMNPADKCMP